MFDRELFKLPGMKAMIGRCALVASLRVAAIVGRALFLAAAIVSIWEGCTIASQATMIALFACCFLAEYLLGRLQESSSERFAHESVAAIRRAALARAYACPTEVTDAHGIGALATSLTEGCLKVERYIALVIPKTVMLIVGPVVIALVILALDPISGIIVIVCFPFIILFMRLIGHTASDESAKRLRGFSVLSNHFIDALRGMSTLKANRVSKGYAKIIHSTSEAYRKQIMKTLRIATLSSTVLDIFATCGLAAVAIMLGFRMVEGDLAFFPALSVLMLVPDYFLPIRSYASDYHATLDGKSALARLGDLTRIQPRRISFDSTLIELSSGSIIAVVGPSGSGKTTLLNALAGVVDSEGLKVALKADDGIGPEDLRKRVAYISQDPSILSASLRENVRLYHPDASDDAIRSALDTVGLAELLECLPEGLDTIIGDSGRQLSGGEAHRVALARALLDPMRDIWLLDEPGADLDVRTEMELKRSMAPLMADKAVVIATHRLHWLDDADTVIDVRNIRTEASHAA